MNSKAFKIIGSCLVIVILLVLYVLTSSPSTNQGDADAPQEEIQ